MTNIINPFGKKKDELFIDPQNTRKHPWEDRSTKRDKRKQRLHSISRFWTQKKLGIFAYSVISLLGSVFTSETCPSSCAACASSNFLPLLSAASLVCCCIRA